MHQNYIKNRQNQLNNKITDFYTPTGIHVYFQNPVEGINVEQVIEKVENVIPRHMLEEIEMIIFGFFEEFEERDINAFYKDNAIYVTPSQVDESDLFDDIVHEISHSLEERYGYEIYADKKMEKEFLRKRIHLHDILWQAGIRAPKSFFIDTEYDQEFDDFLYQKVGYDKLTYFVNGLFINSYAPTSLREYFATGFTEYYLDSNHNYLKKISPVLYEKLSLLQDPKKLD